MSATDELDPTSDRLVFPDGTEYRFIEKPSNPHAQPLVMCITPSAGTCTIAATVRLRLPAGSTPPG